MASKLSKTVIKRSVSPLSDEYIPKQEPVIKTEDRLEQLLNTPRYVHNNPTQFKGRLGYA